MRYGTLIDGSILPAPNPLHMGGMQLFNPTAKQYTAAGYLPIIPTPQPETAEGEEPKYYAARWAVQEGQIVRVWTETEPPAEQPQEPSAPTLEQRVGAVETATAELGEALELILSGATEETEVAADEI